MQRLRSIAAAALALALLVAPAARAQSTATLSGTVTDPQSAVMPGVSITVHNTATNQDRVVVTDAAGAYVAAALAPGHYEVTAHIEGFQDQKREFDLGPAETVALNLKLSVGTLAENVTVSGSSPLIDTATVSVGQVMAEKTVQEIPLNGRHFVDLGPLMPGGSTSPQNAGLSAPLRGQGAFSFMSAGNRETSVNMMVNGINLNDLSNSQVTFQPSINTVSEFKVDNSTFSAEYGRNSGAIVNVATRSGSNQLHGEGFDFYRDQKFDSRNYFNPASLDSSGSVTPQSLFNRKQFGVNLGGPVVKNRSFFFGSYEGLRHLQGVDMNSGTLTDAQRAAVTDPLARKLLQFIPVANDLTGTRAIGSPLAPVTIDQYTIDSRNNLRQNDDLHLYYAFQTDSRLESNAQGQTVPGFPDRRGGHRQIMTVNETHVFSPALVNEVRAGFNRISITFVPQTLVDTGALGINVGQTQNPIALPAITITGPGLVFGGPAGFPSGREVTTFAVGDTATYLHGNHIIKFGGEMRRVKHYGFSDDPGRFTYPSVAAFQQGLGSAFSITLGTQAFNAYVNAIGAFVQDSISLGSSLKLDVGLRYDYLPSPTEQDNKLVTFDPATQSLLQINGQGGFAQVTKNGSDFQPRVGLIWNPAGDSKTVVRGAYAIMVNQSNTGYFAGETGNPPIVNPLSSQANGTATSNIRMDNAINSAGSAATVAPTFTDPNFLPGRMQTWNVNVEREVGRMGLMVGYFGSHGDRQRIPINFNQFVTPGGTTRPFARLSATSPILPGAALGNITEQTSLGWSDYKGLWVTANHRLSHGLQLQGSYTLSKSTDTNSYDGTLTAQNNFDLADSVGPSDFDVRHRMSVNATWELPFHGNRLKDGWQLVVVEQAQTGNPLNIVTNITTITGTATVRPDLIGALPTINPHPNNDANGFPVSYQWFDGQTNVCDPRIVAPAAGSCNSSSVFALPYNAAGVAHFGNLGRNPIYGPAFGNTDFSIIKNLKLQGSARAQFRLEVFNLFNQANLGQPGRTASVGSTSFGVISNTRFPTGDSGSARQVQFAAKFLF
ncbi:MAG TPA: carboxypeptidase regulatory-like domain-containing protein [Vicinamibacterales bacterium]|nr:carboxypeptidase regulatory-like domain-containing protein [Vicinamibacterales bacterium]